MLNPNQSANMLLTPINLTLSASDEASLRALEGLLTEFFHVDTSNDRKRSIEDILNNFGQMEDAWRHCLYYMMATHNEYVMMYCMTILENIINRRWVGMDAQHRIEIRSTLTQYLMAQHQQVPAYVRNKLVKLVVDIGRSDWPHFYPDFFSSILQLAQQTDTAVLGVILLQTASEELAAPREDLSMARREELHRLLSHQIPTVLGLVNNILQTTLEKHRQLVTATPPPSPTSGERTPVTPPNHHSSTQSTGIDLLSNLFKSPTSSGIELDGLPPLDSHSHHLCAMCLSCLAHYFSWIPLSSTITISLLTTIFQFAALGCDTSPSNSSSGPGGGSHSLGILAMNCINELLAKNCVPQEFQDFLLQMFQQTFYILQRLTKDAPPNSMRNKLSEVDENYLEKFTEFLQLFVSVHLRRFESNSQFPMLEFLALLFKYTFKQPNTEGYFTCLDILSTFLDYLHTKLKCRATDRNSILDRYKDALINLVTLILQKCQFRFNQTHLEELDHDTINDDNETEWQHFLRLSLEVIAKVSELFTAETFHLLYVPFTDYLSVYLGLEHHIVSQSTGRRLTLPRENEYCRLHCTLRDLSSLLQAVGRLADHFTGEHFISSFNDAYSLMERLIHTALFNAKLKLYEVTSVVETVLQTDFVEVHSQTLACLKAFSHWLCQFQAETQSLGPEKEKYTKLISLLIDATVPLFHKEVPVKIQQAAAHLLVTLCTTVRPPSLFQLPALQAFYHSVSQGHCQVLPSQVEQLILRALSLYLILPWSNLKDSEQEWELRANSHRTFVRKVTEPYLDTLALANSTALLEEAKPMVEKYVRLMDDWVSRISGEVARSKHICYQSMQEGIHLSLMILPGYMKTPDVADQLLSFFLSIFQALRVQMGVAFTEQTVQTIMILVTRDQLTETINSESGSGCQAIEKFLKILEILVQEPGSSFKALLPNVIDVCINKIYAVIAERQSPDIKPALFQLFHEFLQNNWRYFFKGTAMGALQGRLEEIENTEQFIAIMQAYGQSFLQADINVFRQNLESLESLNSKWKLYHKKLFRETMLFQFLNVLLQVLVLKSHDLLQEEIAISIYNMASVDFDSFYSTFLPQFLTGCEDMDSNQKSILGQNFKLDNDLPSFTHSVHRFVNDLRYYRLVNASLPAGSVKF